MDQQELYHKQLKSQKQVFWNIRAQDARQFCFLMNTSSFYIQAAEIHRQKSDASGDPRNAQVDVVMMLMTCLCYVVLVISYMKPKYMAKLIWLCTVYILLRMSFWLTVAYSNNE